MIKKSRKSQVFTDTYIIEPSDFEWALGYSPDKFNEELEGVSINYVIERNILKKIESAHPDASIYVIENKWIENRIQIIFKIEKYELDLE